MPLIDGRHVNANKRMDGGPKPFHPNNILMQLKYHNDSQTYTLRVDDKANPEFWMEMVISEAELQRAKNTGGG